MTALIYLTGIAVFAMVIYLTLELAPAAPTGRLSEILTPADGVILTGWRKSLSPLDKPVSRWTPAGFLRKTRADLYWAHIGDRWNDWNEVQFTSLRVALAVAGFGLGMVATAEPVFAKRHKPFKFGRCLCCDLSCGPLTCGFRDFAFVILPYIRPCSCNTYVAKQHRA